jgi:SAM-dependent methyltransferase
MKYTMQKSGRYFPGKMPANEFPALYHAHHTRHPEDIPFWLELAREQGGPVLELGCGTGRVLIPLAQVCPAIFGLDNDPEMLAFLNQSLTPIMRKRVKVWLSDLASFHLAARFTLITLPCNTISIISREKRQKTLARVYHHLQPGGIFAASMPNPEFLVRLSALAESEVEEVFPHPFDGEPVQVSSSWKRIGRTFTIYWNYDHLLPDGRVDRVQSQTRHLLESPQTYVQELVSVGFENPLLLGDFDDTPYSGNSPYLIILAKRQP